MARFKIRYIGGPRNNTLSTAVGSDEPPLQIRAYTGDTETLYYLQSEEPDSQGFYRYTDTLPK